MNFKPLFNDEMLEDHEDYNTKTTTSKVACTHMSCPWKVKGKNDAFDVEAMELLCDKHRGLKQKLDDEAEENMQWFIDLQKLEEMGLEDFD